MDAAPQEGRVWALGTGIHMYVVWYKQNPIYVCSKVQDAIDLVCLEIEGASLISISKPRSAVDAAPRRRSFEYYYMRSVMAAYVGRSHS